MATITHPVEGTAIDGVPPRPVPLKLVVILAGVAVALGIAIAFSSRGVESGRLHNPDPAGTVVYDGVPRAHEPFLGVERWPQIMEGLTVVTAAGFWLTFGVKSWRQRQVHPALILMAASTALLVFDPFVNWAAFVVFDPRLLHLPASWPYVSLAPLVEPIFVVAGYPFYLLIPGLIAAPIHRRWVQPRLRPQGFWARHALVTAFAIGFVIAVVFDVIAELSMVRTELWVFSQATGPVIHVGPHQWPVLVEPMLFSPTMAVTAVMLHRDDRGRTLMARVVERRGGGSSIAKQILVAWAIYAIAYVGLYAGSFSLFRISGMATSLNQPHPFQETKVYDPQGRYEDAGEPGPFYDGIWSGPDARDDPQDAGDDADPAASEGREE